MQLGIAEREIRDIKQPTQKQNNMIEELNFLKAGTMAKSLSADVGLVTFRDGIASTYDGATSCRIPLDIGHDVSVRLFTLSRAVAVLGEGFAIKKMTANLQLSNDGVKIHVPFLVNNEEGYTASRGAKIDVPEGFAEAVRAVLPFSEVTPRDFTACVHISDGYALATSGNTVARYPLDTSFLEGRSLTIDAQSLSALVRGSVCCLSASPPAAFPASRNCLGMIAGSQ